MKLYEIIARYIPYNVLDKSEQLIIDELDNRIQKEIDKM